MFTFYIHLYRKTASFVEGLIPKKQTPAIYLSLAGRACEAALQLSVKILNSDEGVTELMKALDSLYLKDKDQFIYEAYDNF